MIGVVGVKRLIILGALLGLNALFASVVYVYLIPENTKAEREARTVTRQVKGIQDDIDRMQLEFDQLEHQQQRFNALKADGFFDYKLQSRSKSKELFDALREKSGVISAEVLINSGEIEKNAEADKAKHKIIKRPVQISIKAFDDTDVYSYLYLAEKIFPGHLMIEDMSIKRDKEVNSAVLRAIASGVNPDLVDAEINLTWRTMLPDEYATAGKKE